MANIKPAEIAWMVALLGLLVYEVYALASGRATLSQAVWTVDRSRYGALLPFLVGVLCGHFFFSGN